MATVAKTLKKTGSAKARGAGQMPAAIKLSAKDSRIVLNALKNPPKPSDKLKAALRGRRDA
jgi:uncharacterized protein (DUF1778 family)